MDVNMGDIGVACYCVLTVGEIGVACYCVLTVGEIVWPVTVC